MLQKHSHQEKWQLLATMAAAMLFSSLAAFKFLPHVPWGMLAI
jgi:hypothetical protein